MHSLIDALRVRLINPKTGCFSAACGIALLAAVSAPALAQVPAPQPETPAQSPVPQSPAPETASPATTAETASSSSPSPHPAIVKDPLLSAGAFSIQTVGGEIKEDQLKQLLVGKTLYLRNGYQDNNLEFDENGRLTGHSPQGSFTLSQIQINKVKLSKHKLELVGDRYALHFLGAAPYEDPTKATDVVKITPKKKSVRISFDREQVEIPKKKKNKHKHKDDHPADVKSAKASDAADSGDETKEAVGDAPSPLPTQTVASDHSSDKKVKTTTSPAHASQLLLTALDKVLSRGVDDRMIAAMPDFWKLYYQAAAAKVDYKPTDPGVYLPNAVDQKAKLVSAVDPPSNEFAQKNGVAGIAMYHAVVGSDGKVEEVVAGRPIGFGLDENAEQTIRKAAFQPAVKDGKPVPVALDLVVSFRIYSNRTSQPSTQEESADKPNQPVLPGPYTVQEQAQAAHEPQPAQPQAEQPQAEPSPSEEPAQSSQQQSHPTPSPQ